VGTLIRHAVILAAGRGNRMRPLTDVIPKAMLPYRGGTLIGNSLEMLREVVPDVHITVGYQSAMLSQYVLRFGVSSILNTDGHENSWWIHNTLMRYVDSPVLVLTCDNITKLNLDFLEAEYRRCGMPPCMLVPVTPIPMVAGDYIEHDGGIVMSLQREEPRPIYCSGIQVLNPRQVACATRPGGSFYDIWRQLIARRELRVCEVYPNSWFSVDTLEQLAMASAH
jgi:NDP-sugar pyrophosphorylase family protein